jgi:flagellar protein FliL
MAEKAKPTDAVQPAPKRKGSLVKIIVILLIVVAIGGGAAWFFFMRPAAAHEGTAGSPGTAEGHEGTNAQAGAQQAQYLALDPAFVVNLADEDAQHYLQADIQVMARSAEVLEAVKTHTPRIRNNLLLLFSEQKTTDVRDRAGRERLQAAALHEVQEVIKAETGKPGVEALYFTSFVTQ